MHRPITRRDFIGGVAVGIGGAAWLAGCGPGEPPLPPDPGFERAADYYPPAQGRSARQPRRLVRGRASPEGRPDVARRRRRSARDLRPGRGRRRHQRPGRGALLPRSGPAPPARVLVLDNHDDFGGHAKRNEFTHDGRTYIGYGGTQSIDSPAPYSATAKALITELGIDVAELPARCSTATCIKSLGLSGGDVLRQGDLRRRQARGRHLAQSDQGVPRPVAAAAPQVQAQILRLVNEKRDVMPGPVVGREEGAPGAHELHRLRRPRRGGSIRRCSASTRRAPTACSASASTRCRRRTPGRWACPASRA